MVKPAFFVIDKKRKMKDLSNPTLRQSRRPIHNREIIFSISPSGCDRAACLKNAVIKYWVNFKEVHGRLFVELRKYAHQIRHVHLCRFSFGKKETGYTKIL